MKKIFYIILLLFIFSLILLPSAAQEDDGNKINVTGSKQAFVFGKQKYNNKEYETAKELFSKAITMDPNNVEAYYYRALSANMAGSLQGDVNFYTIRSKTNKEDYKSIFGLACCHLAQSETFEGKKKDAKDELNRVLSLDKEGSFGQRARELAEQYKIQLSEPPFNIMEHKWIFGVIGAVILLIIIIIAVMFMKSAPKFFGTIIITNPQGQIMLNNKLDTLPKRDKKRVKIGSGNMNDIILSGGNVTPIHAELIPIKFNNKDRIRIIPMQMSKVTRETGGKSEQIFEDLLWDNDSYKIGDYKLEYSNPALGSRPDTGLIGASPGMLPAPPSKSSFAPPSVSSPSPPPVSAPSPFPPVSSPSPPPAGGGTNLPSPPPSSSDDGFSF
jgi:hypothetical protein